MLVGNIIKSHLQIQHKAPERLQSRNVTEKRFDEFWMLIHWPGNYPIWRALKHNQLVDFLHKFGADLYAARCISYHPNLLPFPRYTVIPPCSMQQWTFEVVQSRDFRVVWSVEWTHRRDYYIRCGIHFPYDTIIACYVQFEPPQLLALVPMHRNDFSPESDMLDEAILFGHERKVLPNLFSPSKGTTPV